MADEAKLVVELVDKGGTGAAATNPVQAGSSYIPGSTLASDYQQQITDQGAGAKAGLGSSTPTPVATTAIPAATPAPSPNTATEGIGSGFKIANPPDTAMAGVAAGILRASPNTTAAELQAALGISASDAQGYIDHAFGVVRASLADKPIEAQLVDQINPAKSLSIHEAAGNLNAVLNSAGGLPNLGSMLGGQTGAALGNLAQTALINLPQLLPAGAQGATTGILGSIAANAGPIAAGIGIAGAAIAIPTAATYQAINEAERAVSITSRYSPDVAREQALADVRQVMADLRSTERLGDEAAEYTRQRSRISTASQGIRDVISEPVIDVLNANLKAVADSLNGLSSLIDANPTVVAGFQKLVEFWGNNASFILGGGVLGRLVRTLLKWADDQEAETGINPFDWFDGQEHLDPPPPFTTTNEQPVGVSFNPIPGLNI